MTSILCFEGSCEPTKQNRKGRHATYGMLQRVKLFCITKKQEIDSVCSITITSQKQGRKWPIILKSCRRVKLNGDSI
jgi:hypothetical protein